MFLSYIILIFCALDKISCFAFDETALKFDENSTLIENFKFDFIKDENNVSFPESFILNLNQIGFNININFMRINTEKHPIVSDSIFQYEPEVDEVIEHFDSSLNSQIAFYHDTNDLCAVTLIKNSDNSFKTLGTCYINEHVYTILPINLNPARKKRDTNRDLFNPHAVFKQLNNLSNIFTDYIKLESDLKMNVKNWASFDESIRPNDSFPLELTIELLIVTDYSIYQNFKKFTGIKDQKLLLTYMKIYFSQFANGINFKYLNSFKDDTELRLTVKLKNFIFSINSNDSDWSDPKKVGFKEIHTFKSKEVILADEALGALAQYLNKKNLNFTYDHAVGITSKDLWSSAQYFPSDQRSMLSGMAFFGRICSPFFKFSIVEDNGLLSGITTMAHELGHNLGSEHDSDPGFYSYCNAYDGFIMAPTSRIGLNSNKFSFCSITAFKNFILTDYFTSSNFECLAETEKKSDKNKTLSSRDPNLGDFWTPDEQCKIMFGKNASFCQDLSGDICLNLYCRQDATSDYCTSMGGALQGTVCESGKVCVHSECIKEKKAKIGECLYGDDSVVRYYGTNEPLTCEKYLEKSLSESGFTRNECIYNWWIQNKCCETCKIFSKMNCFDLYSNCHQLKQYCILDGTIKLGCPKTCGLCSTKITCEENGSTLCQNGGTCKNITTDNVKAFKCDCKKGFSGLYCEAKNPCLPNPCQDKKSCFRIGKFGHLCS
ncbi:unnamed protein product [Brachionus calyciflorus]|uniref:Uncharacterized protein n=1 Tax=Brachionus calyciflorus TaxID=104777 RepID=A0A814ALU3_9BILA|nr:unnamed protein product [Brachionus calyciflorus]